MDKSTIICHFQEQTVRVPILSSASGKQRMRVHRCLATLASCHHTAIILPGQSLYALVVSFGVSTQKSIEICHLKDDRPNGSRSQIQNQLELGGLHLLVRWLRLNTNWAASHWLRVVRPMANDDPCPILSYFWEEKPQKSDGFPVSHMILFDMWVRKNRKVHLV